METKPSEIGDDAGDSAGNQGAVRNPYSRRNVKRAAWQYLLGRVLTGCGGLAFLIVLVRTMEATAFAGFVTMLGYAATVGLLSGLGLDKVATRYVPEGRLFHVGPALNRLISVLVLTRLLVLLAAALTTFFIWPLLAKAFSLADSEAPFALILLIVGFNLFQFVALILQALVQQSTLTVIVGAQWLVRLGILSLMISLNMPIRQADALWISAVPELLGMLALLLILRAYLNGLHKLGTPAVSTDVWPSQQEVLALSAHNYGYAWLVAAPQGNSMVMVSAALVAAPFVAAYGFFAGLIDRIKMYLPLMLMLNLVEPILTAAYVQTKNLNKLGEQAVLLYKINCFLVVMLAVWTAIVAVPLTSALTNGKFLDYAFVLPVLLIQLALGSHNLILQTVANSVGRSDLLPKSGIVSLVVMALFLLCLIGFGRGKYFYVAPLIYEVTNSCAIIFLLRANGFHYPSTMAFHIRLVLLVVFAYLLCQPLAAAVSLPLATVLVAGAGVCLVFAAGLYGLSLLGAAEWGLIRDVVRTRKYPA